MDAKQKIEAEVERLVGIAADRNLPGDALAHAILQTLASNAAEVERLRAQNAELSQALRHLEHNATKSGANMGLALDVARRALTNQQPAKEQP